MRLLTSLSLVLALSGLLGCDASTGTTPMGTGDGGTPSGFRDTDGDGISDNDEGRAMNVDTDGDGTPDFRDDDSDGDGIIDQFERGTGPRGGTPVDSDGDGTPDFRDLDSDGNGIPDETESSVDSDGDGVGDYADRDNDGDNVPDAQELGDDPTNPLDFDEDGLPDYLDVDSDDDSIADGHEYPADTDMDGFYDRHDSDSDGDGIPDSEEAGDVDPATPPRDSDMDGAPDFQDVDSDNDGLSDANEVELGTDPTNEDSDMDGVTDLVEIAACPDGDMSCAGDATNPDHSPRTRGDFVFFEPFEQAPMPTQDTLSFSTNLQVADVYFLIDTTGSMSGPIANVRSSLSGAGGIIAQIRAEIPDTWFGIGEFKDYGDPFIYRNNQDLTNDPAAAQAAANALRHSGGGDTNEGGIPAMWSVANGMGVSAGTGSYPARGTACPDGRFGYPCWRPGAVPILVLIADQPFHNGPGYTGSYGGYLGYDTALPVLQAANIRAIGVSVGTSPQAMLNTIATDTGAVDGAGNPLVSVASGGTVSESVVNQIRTLANSTPLDISLVYVDDPSDSIDSYMAFVDRVVANEAGDAERGCAPRMGEDTDSDGNADTFRAVTPGMPVCFDIHTKQNDTVMPTEEPQIFRATLRVLGDGFTEVDSRDIFFLVPPVIEGPGVPL